MITLHPLISLQEFQAFNKEVYYTPNNKHYELTEMLINIQRFAMRGLKGIRKRDEEKTRKNLMISFSWFLSVLNRLNIDLEEAVWKRFPFVCSYCNNRPCVCRETNPEKRHPLSPPDESKKPKMFLEFQKMFNEIYPASTRSLEHAGVHLAEESGEFSETFWTYRSNRKEDVFQKLKEEAADYFSCLIGVFNSIGKSLVDELKIFFQNNTCHACRQSPCRCTFEFIKDYKS